MKKVYIEKKFIEYRQYLTNEATTLAGYIELYNCLQERRNDRLDELNLAPGFFRIVLKALFSVIVIWVNNMYDKNSERGLHNFLNFIESNITIFTIDELKRRNNYPDDHWMLKRNPITKESIQNDRDKIIKIKSLTHFKKRRDKFHGHFDKKYFFNRKKIAQDAPLLKSDLTEVIDVMKELINRYSTGFDGEGNYITPINATDIDKILNILHDHLNNT